jgi:hypothetical protein
MYLDRLLQRYPTLLFTPQNIFKLFFTAARIASKVLDLRSLNNKNFASVGGVTNKHLNELEANLLADLGFDLYFSQEEFARYARRVMQVSGGGLSTVASLTVSKMLACGESCAITQQPPRESSPRGVRANTLRPQISFAPPPPLPAGRRATTDGISLRGVNVVSASDVQRTV